MGLSIGGGVYGVNPATDVTGSEDETSEAVDEDVSTESPGPGWSEMRGERSLL